MLRASKHSSNVAAIQTSVPHPAGFLRLYVKSDRILLIGFRSKHNVLDSSCKACLYNYVNFAKNSRMEKNFPFWYDSEEKLEVLSFLLYAQDFRARMPEKGSCCAMDGASASGPSITANDRAENLELPAFFHRNTGKGNFSPSGVRTCHNVNCGILRGFLVPESLCSQCNCTTLLTALPKTRCGQWFCRPRFYSSLPVHNPPLRYRSVQWTAHGFHPFGCHHNCPPTAAYCRFCL